MSHFVLIHEAAKLLSDADQLQMRLLWKVPSSVSGRRMEAAVRLKHHAESSSEQHHEPPHRLRTLRLSRASISPFLKEAFLPKVEVGCDWLSGAFLSDFSQTSGPSSGEAFDCSSDSDCAFGPNTTRICQV